MAEVTCPTLNDFTNADRCAENIGGMCISVSSQT